MAKLGFEIYFGNRFYVEVEGSDYEECRDEAYKRIWNMIDEDCAQGAEIDEGHVYYNDVEIAMTNGKLEPNWPEDIEKANIKW